MKKVFFALWLALLMAPIADAATPTGCENETGLAGRSDILKCEAWEDANWWQLGWFMDQGDTGSTLDGRRFHRFPATIERMNNVNPNGLSIVTSGCLVGSCLKVKTPKWQDAIGSFMAQSYIIPGQGGCSHDTLGCVPQQEIYLRYYMKLSPNWDPENYYHGDGTPLQGGGKFPGLGDPLNGWSGNPAAIQCGNGGEGPTDGTECWSLRANFSVPFHSDNGPRHACTEHGIYTCSTRFGFYPYMYVPLQVEGSRYTSAFWDGFYSPSIDFADPAPPHTPVTNGQCSDTYGFECGLGTPGLINNKWYLVEMRVKMNTPGVPDGVMQAWLDGVLKYSKTNAVFRNPGHNNIGIRNAWFDVFAGGSNVGMKEDMYVLFDQMVISTGSRPGPWTGDIRGNMIAVNSYLGMNGFARAHYLSNVLPSNGGCYLQMGGAGSVSAGENWIKCTNFTQVSGSLPGVTTSLFAGDNSANVSWPSKCDNYASFYWPHLREWWKTGCSYIEPASPAVPANSSHYIVSSRIGFGNCVSTFTVNCATVLAFSRWNTTVATAAGSEWDNAFAGVVKNANFRGTWRTDNGAIVNPHIRTAFHGHGYSNNGQVWAVTPNLSGTLCIPTGSPSGAEPMIHCELPTNPKQLPIYTNGSCGDQPIGSGTSPGIRRQGMNVYTHGPYDDRALYVFGSRAEENCSGLTGTLRSRDWWVMSAVGGVSSWTQLASPPTISDTPLVVYNPERNEHYAQVDDKIYRYPLFGENTWYDATPAGGLGLSCFNMYGAYDEASRLFIMHDGNNTDTNQGSAGCQGIKAFSMENAAVMSEPVVGFAAPTSSGGEGTTPALIPVTLTNPPAGTVTVNFAVTGGSASGSGVDYTLASGQLSFSGGTVTQNISVTLVDDNLPEANETIQITLSGQTGGAALGISNHVFTITDNDAFWASSGVGAGAQAAGNDSNDCRSINTPCLTLDGVLAKYRALNGYNGANGVVNLRAGDYDSKGFKAGGMVTIPSGSSWASPFVLKAYDGDRTVRIIREDRHGPITKTVAEMQTATCTSSLSGETNLDCVGAPTVAECKARGGAAAGSYPQACWNGAPDSNFLYLRLNRSGGDFHGAQNMSDALIDWYGLGENAANNVRYVVFDGLIFDGRGVAVNIMRNTVSWAHTVWGQYLKFRNGAIRNATGSCFAQPGIGGNDNGAADGSPYGNTYLGVSWEREAVWNGSAYVNGPYHKNNWVFEGTLADPFIVEKCGIPFNTYVVPGQTPGLTARDHPNAAFLHGWYTSLGGNECYHCELRLAAGNGAGAEGDDNIISKSYVHSNAISGHYITGSNTLIENSIFYNNGAAELHAYGCQSSIVRNNTFVAGPRSSIGIQVNVNCYNNNLFENNIFVGYPINDFYVNYVSTAWSGAPPNVLRNNLMYTAAGTISSPYRNVGSVVTPTIAGNILNQNPLLANVPVDFGIPTNSPAKDAGFNNGLSTDRLGNTRPFGTAIDIGAYEFCTGGGCSAAPTTAIISVVSAGANNVSIAWTGGAGCSLTSPQATSFNIVCPLGTSITFTAPATSGGANFSSWTGCTTSGGVNCTVTNLTAGLTVTATYGALKSLTVSSTIAAAAPIVVSPADSGGASNGTTAFVRTYPTNTAVTLTAPGNVGNVYFNNWSGCDSTSGFGGVICTITLNVDRAATANYGGTGCGVDKDNVTIGTRVTLCADTTVRDAANGNAVGSQTAGAAGAISAGPTEGGGVLWVQTNFDSGVDGWTTRRNLVPVVSASRVPAVTLKSGERRVVGSGKVVPVQ